MTRLLFVVAPFYRDYADALIAGASAVCERQGVAFDIVEVPGALEIPGAIRLAMESAAYDGYVALGCVIRGETYHFEVVSNESARGLMTLTTEFGLAIGNGILTCENDEQAWVRADPQQKNKGGEAAEACLRMVALFRRFTQEDAA
jgi:6,7-dimethyl-8-ribityllumazine synthase